ncbi:MAG: HRDC domain-containing protein [Pirellulaceae bacterium]
MQYKILSVPASGDPEADEELNRFLRGHRVVSVQKELVQNNSVAYWCFCIEYLHGAIAGGDKGKGRSRVDYKEVLSEEDFALFARLRDLRKQLAAAEAIPVYAVCTNEQLAEMAKQRPCPRTAVFSCRRLVSEAGVIPKRGEHASTLVVVSRRISLGNPIARDRRIDWPWHALDLGCSICGHR